VRRDFLKYFPQKCDYIHTLELILRTRHKPSGIPGSVWAVYLIVKAALKILNKFKFHLLRTCLFVHNLL